MRHEYLLALHESGSAVAQTGWSPRFFTIERGGLLVAACPGYLKAHSYGEYVFDWAWADAYQRHGLAYYPKLLVAVPFTPVPGTRLMALDAAAREALAQALVQVSRDSELSSLHVLFPELADAEALSRAGCLQREGVQFHWVQDEAAPMHSFSDLLSRMQRDKRKKIQQERRRVADAGVRFTIAEGQGIDKAQWDFFHHCYTLTYQAHHSTPYLTRDFFARLAATLPSHWVMFTAWRNEQRLASSLIAVDRAQSAAWGRYWGCTEYLPGLHFDACYYQPLDWCLTHGIRRFEGGAQGEHKIARGLLPARTRSLHWLSDPRFTSAVADFLAREGAGMAQYVGELQAHTPFKTGPR